jgi:O-antigen/teichoic acid export membrane protein
MGIQPSLHKNAILNVSYSVLRLLFPLITFPYVSRIIGPTGIGAANYYQAVAHYFILLANLGLPMYGAREIARARGNEGEFGKLFSELVVIGIVFAGIGVAAYVAAGVLLPDLFNDRTLFLLFGLTVATNFGLLDWFFRGTEQYGFIVSRNLAIRIAAVGAIFLFIRTPDHYQRYAAIWVAETVIGSLVNLLYATRRVRVSLHAIRPFRHVKPMLATAGVVVTGTIYGGLDTVMLGAIMADNNASVGYYALAMRLIRIAASVITAGITVVMPRVARHDEDGATDRLYRIVRLNLDYSLFVSMGIAVGIYITAPDVVMLFGGPEFAQSVSTLRILAIQIPIVSVGTIFGSQLLFARRLEKQFLISLAMAMVVAVVLNVALIPRWGHNGAAVGTLAARTVEMVVQALFVAGILRQVMNKGLLLRIAGVVLAWTAGLVVLSSMVSEIGTVGRVLIVSVAGATSYVALGKVAGVASVNHTFARLRRKKSP